MTRARDELLLSHAADYGGARARRVSPFVLEALDLPVAAGIPGAGARSSTPRRAPGHVRPDGIGRERAGWADHRAALAELLPGRRLPDLPAQVQVRARPARPARAAPRDHLRRGPAQGGPAVPPPACQGPGHERGGARCGLRRGLVERRVHEPRPRGGPADGRPSGAAPVPRGPAPAGSRHPDLCRARVRVHARWRSGARPVGPRRRRGDRVRGSTGRGRARTCRERPTERRRGLADARDPGSGAGDDHRLQVVRRARPGQGAPAGARVAPAPDLRDGLRGDDRPAARRHRACTSSSRASSARSRSTPGGWPGRASGSPPPRPGCGRATTPRSPTTWPARYCAFRDICPSSVAR